MDSAFAATTLLPFLKRCSVSASVEDLSALDSFRLLLADANRSFNLTRVLDEHGFWIKHVADSFSIGIIRPQFMKARLTIADIGFGGGFPIIPLAWANEKLHLIGIERKQRKADFVRTAALALGLKNIQIHVCQAREAANSETLTGSCDAVIARAVGESGMLLKHSRGLLRPEGPAEILLYKTPESLRNELPVAEREAKKHGFTVNVSEEIQLPCEAGQRQFLIFSRRNLRQ